MARFRANVWRAVRGVRFGRLVVVLLSAALAGLFSDWLRGEERLVFPRPLPALKTKPPR